MVILIILIVLVVLGIYLIGSNNSEGLGIAISVLFGCYLFIHVVVWSLSSYEYEIFVEKRNAFESTLESARKSGNQYETAAIVKEVSDWNVSLASMKYDNKKVLLGDYFDDRVEELKPIK